MASGVAPCFSVAASPTVRSTSSPRPHRLLHIAGAAMPDFHQNLTGDPTIRRILELAVMVPKWSVVARGAPIDLERWRSWQP